jgi:hypothetical protein
MKDTATQVRSKGLTAPMILIVVGLVMFLARNGFLDRALLLQLLPLIPLAIGASLLFSRMHRR